MFLEESKEIPQLLESKGLWEKEFLIAFHILENRISHFEKKNYSWELKIYKISYQFNLYEPEKAYLKIYILFFAYHRAS